MAALRSCPALVDTLEFAIMRWEVSYDEEEAILTLQSGVQARSLEAGEQCKEKPRHEGGAASRFGNPNLT